MENCIIPVPGLLTVTTTFDFVATSKSKSPRTCWFNGLQHKRRKGLKAHIPYRACYLSYILVDRNWSLTLPIEL